MTYWKIEELRKLIKIQKEDDPNEEGTITKNYIHDLKMQLRLMEQAYDEGLKSIEVAKSEGEGK